jgi:hypothetical protein
VAWIVTHMKAVLVVCGVLTCTMVYAVLAPHAAMRSTFGEGLEGAAAEIVVRNWGALIALGGGMLIYSAFHPASRPLALGFTGLGKLSFIGLVLSHGGRYLDDQAGVAVVVDAVMVALFAAYLVGVRSRPASGTPRGT